MRILKLLLAGLLIAATLMAGFFVVAAIAAIGAVVLAGRRLFGRAPAPLPVPPARQRPPEANALDVIDVTATEVRADSR